VPVPVPELQPLTPFVPVPEVPFVPVPVPVPVPELQPLIPFVPVPVPEEPFYSLRARAPLTLLPLL